MWETKEKRNAQKKKEATAFKGAEKRSRSKPKRVIVEKRSGYHDPGRSSPLSFFLSVVFFLFFLLLSVGAEKEEERRDFGIRRQSGMAGLGPFFPRMGMGFPRSGTVSENHGVCWL